MAFFTLFKVKILKLKQFYFFLKISTKSEWFNIMNDCLRKN